ncbi:hypothetical protein FHS36_006562 [Streptomyces eurocidicus]|uniref:Uncharacterized protein n=1 Tax=Streptomyces eurocidicus TaxID=66423 RepID=A0A7W8BGU8_STREU|nr:hypothetical protein [Streptomyces eurocidicus]
MIRELDARGIEIDDIGLSPMALQAVRSLRFGERGGT